MAGIKISDLPPNTLPLVGDEKMELEDANGDSTQATVADIASSAAGLDATFITVSANAALPNERVLTAGTNITLVDGGPNSTITINATGLSFPILAPDGSAAAPSYSWSTESGTGIHLIAANLMGFSIVGTTNWEMGGLFQAANNAGPAMSNTAVSSTIPGLLPAQQDPNTGIGSNTLDQLSLIAGGAEIARATAAFNANQFAIIQSGSSSVPELTSLADPDTGFRWPADNTTVWIGGGSRAWNFSTAKFFSQFSNGPALLNEISSDTNPTVVADHADPDTGIGSSGNDELSIIAGGVEGIRVEETAGNVFITYFGPILVPFGSGTQPGGAFDGDDDTGYFRPVDDAFGITAGGVEAVRYAELSGEIIQTNRNQVGLTASVTQTQAGGLALLSSYNEVATVGTTGDALTAFAVKAGDRLTVINNGANDLQLFPAVGDDIGAGVDTAITIAAGELGIFIGRDATNWDTLFNGAASVGPISFPILAPDGTAGAPSYSFSGETDLGIFRLAEDFLGFSVNGITRIVVDTSGITGFIGNSGKIVSVGATANFPSVLAANGDTNTGMGWGGIDIVTLAAGGIEGVRFSEQASHIIQGNENHTGLTASVTQTQAGGLALLSSYNEVSTVANSGDALTAFGVAEGSRLVVVNNGANDLQLFPDSGEDIGNGANASITIIAGEIGIFLGRDSATWDTLYNAAASPSFAVPDPLLLSDGSAAAPTYSFASDPDTGMFRLGTNTLCWSTSGVLRWTINPTELTAGFVGAPLFRGAVAASATVPTVMPNNTDINTGLGWFASDQLSLVAGGGEILRAVRSPDQVLVPAGTATDPGLSFLTDDDTGFASLSVNEASIIGGGAILMTLAGGGVEIFANAIVSGDVRLTGVNAPEMVNEAASATNPTVIPNRADSDTGVGGVAGEVSLISNGVEGVRFATTSSRVIQTNANHVGLVASVTQTQVGGLALLSSYNEITTVANVGDALTAFGVDAGERLIVINNGVNALQLFPAVGDNFGAGVDTAIEINSGSVGVFIGRDVTNWDTLFLGDPDNLSPGGATVSGTWRFSTSTVEADPGVGNFRNDNATIGSVTEVFINSVTRNGFDADNILGFLGSGDQLYIQNEADASEFMLFSITANVDNGGWYSLAGTVAASGSNFSGNTDFGILLLFGGTGGVAVQVPNDVVQARRTTGLLLTTAFVDVTLDTTDVESDAAVLDHDLVTNTDNIIIGATGTYKIGYEVDIEVDTTNEGTITADGRVRVNDGGVGLPGSDALCGVFSDGSIIADFMQNHLSQTFYAELTSGDFITLQLEKVELGGSDDFTATRVLFTAERCL